jgi:recombinational DNA repair ATPase RecF
MVGEVKPAQQLVISIESEEEREKLLELIDRNICEMTKKLDRKRLETLERLRMMVNDCSPARLPSSEPS